MQLYVILCYYFVVLCAFHEADDCPLMHQGSTATHCQNNYRFSSHFSALLPNAQSLLLQYVQVMNLTAVRERGEAWERHIEDSLALLPLFEKHAPGSATAPLRVRRD